MGGDKVQEVLPSGSQGLLETGLGWEESGGKTVPTPQCYTWLSPFVFSLFEWEKNGIKTVANMPDDQVESMTAPINKFLNMFKLGKY